MTDILPPDYGTDVGQVRLLIPDTAQGEYIFEDAQIEGFLNISGNHVLRAGALAMSTLANDTAMVLKHIRTYDLAVNGPAVADSLRKGAEALLERADNEEESEMFEGAFEIVDSGHGMIWPEGAVLPAYGRVVGIGPWR